MKFIQADYVVSEDDQDVTVCAVVKSATGLAYCPVGFEFMVALSTESQSAGSF